MVSSFTHIGNAGMEFFSDQVMRGLLASSLETASLGPDGFTDVGRGPGSTEANYIDWLTIDDNAKSVLEDVERIRNHPLVPDRIPIYGFPVRRQDLAVSTRSRTPPKAGAAS
jgi:carbonic anhydrase